MAVALIFVMFWTFSDVYAKFLISNILTFHHKVDSSGQQGIFGQCCETGEFVKGSGQVRQKKFNIDLLIAQMDLHDNMSQRELARRVGVQHGTVQNWFGGSTPSDTNIKKVADVFKMNASDFLMDPFDLLHSQYMTLLYKIFLRVARGELEVKVSLTALVRGLDKVGVFESGLPDESEPTGLEGFLRSVEATALEKDVAERRRVHAHGAEKALELARVLSEKERDHADSDPDPAASDASS